MKRHAAVIITYYNQKDTIGRALTSALTQTFPTEVYIVDDGSQEFPLPIEDYGNVAYVIRHEENRGVAEARNSGLKAALANDACGFVMFLDGDDEIDPTKIEEQVAMLAKDQEAGWVYCDTRIFGVTGREQLASQRYAYRTRIEVQGYLFWEMLDSNFIPLHAPLYRREVFAMAGAFDPAAEREDWDFLTRVSCVSKALYLDKVLCSYYRSPKGRNQRAVEDSAARVLRLNLGCGDPKRASWHPLPGFLNLDRHTVGWEYEKGLPFPDNSVDAITISHSIFMVAEKDWPYVLGECFRVLKPRGIIRITEDDAVHPDSLRKGGWRGSEHFVTITCAEQTLKHLRTAGFDAVEVSPTESAYAGPSLIQHFHGDPPDVYHVEGRKP